ncbi:MAG: hypothetical protein ABI702_19020 [Burkholderiales bacterium]
MLRTGVAWIVCGWLAAGSASAALSEGRPAVGRHAGELCVATASAAPVCGPAQVDLRRDGSARVRVDDVVYRLQLHSSQVEVVLMHGAMQIDEFTAPYDWVGSALQFNDDERQVRYEVRFTKRGGNEQGR